MNLSPLFPIAAAAFAMQSGPGPDTAAVVRQIDAMYPKLEAVCADLHANPQSALHESFTAAKLAAEMRPIGFEVTEKVGKTGLVAVYKNGEGPTVLVRTELDGGHDVHKAGWLGAAKTLVALQSQWKGTLVFIAQPAKENGGAKAMLADGLFTRFAKPDYAFALRPGPLANGTVGYDSGIAASNSGHAQADNRLMERTAAILKQAFGEANVARMPATGAAEDFSAFDNEGVPSMFFFTGSYEPKAIAESGQTGGKSYAPVPEPSIKTAAEAMSLAVLDVMARR